MRYYTDIRDAIFEELYRIAARNRRLILFTADIGVATFKKFKKNLPAQFYNVGVAEQNAVSVASGLASTGRRVFIFGITNFVTLRCFEQIKIDICCLGLPVTILGMGTGYVYGEDGPTHHMSEDLSLMRTLPGLTIWSPSDCAMAAALVHLAYQNRGPSFIRFDKGPFPKLYERNSTNFLNGLTVLKKGKDVTIIATGIMVAEALKVAAELEKSRIKAGVIDMYRLKPVNKDLLFKAIHGVKRIVTLEEHSQCGGLGSIICEVLTQSNRLISVKILGIPDVFRRHVGNREALRALDGIDAFSAVRRIREWLK